jgi:hypothetical protein
VQRQDLTIRSGTGRFIGLTSSFSKKPENLAAAVSMHLVYYTFARPTRHSPAQRASHVSDDGQGGSSCADGFVRET